MELSYHSILLLAGVAVTGLALLGAIVVGPYGRRGVRITLATVSVVAFLATAFWLTVYLSLIEQRRSIEARLSELRGQALAAGSALACLEHTGDAVDTACAQKIFATPEILAAAGFYTSARLDLLFAALRYSGPPSPQFDDAIRSLKASLQQDALGFTANVLALRHGCSTEQCRALAAFENPERLRNNIRQRVFDANVARYASAWGTQTPSAGLTPVAPAGAPAGAEPRAPIPEKYSLPSAASIPPVSIMNEEPTERSLPSPPSGNDRPNIAPTSAAPSSRREQAPAAATAAPPSPAEKQAPARREKMRPSAPLSISPTR